MILTLAHGQTLLASHPRLSACEMQPNTLLGFDGAELSSVERTVL